MARVYLDERTNWWCMDYRDSQGRRKQVKAGRTKTMAEAILRKTLDEVSQAKINGGKVIKPIQFDKFAEEYLVYSQSVKKFYSSRRDRTSIRNLNEVFSGKILTSITSKEIEKYKMERRLIKKPATVNRELACLKNMFTKAIQWGYASFNPVKEIKLYKENNQRVRYLEPRERELLLACCGPYLRPIVLTALHTGMRRSEILNLKWSDVDFSRYLITVRDTKNSEVRYIPMNETLTETLRNVTKNINSPYVFLKNNGHPYKEFKESFTAVLKRAGIENLTFHDFRHDFASHLVMAGVDIKTVQELLGHKGLQMTLRYAHLSPAHKQDAVGKLEAYIEDEKLNGNATQKQHRELVKFAV